MTHDRDIELVRELHPPADQRTASDAARARERARVALMAEIERVDTARRSGSSLHLPRLRQRRLAAVLALGIAVAVAVAVLLSLRGGAANPPSAAAAVLQRAAHAVAATGGPGQLQPGEYWYVKSYDTSAGATVAAPSVRGGIRVIVDALTTSERQVWISVDRRGLDLRRITRPITFLSAAARQQWIRYGRPRQVPLHTRWSVPPDSFYLPYRQLQALPSNVDALWQMFARHAGNSSAASKHAEMFTEIGDLLRYQPIPAKVRAALYLTAARIPGIQMLGLTHDAIGRPALAVALNDTLSGMRTELLFDPHTYTLLGETSVVVKPPPAYHVKPGSIRTGSTYVTFGIVERIGQVPGR
jgi:hypothetical protein